jgi:hypothetical protein
MQSSHPKVDNIVSLVPLLEEQKLIIEMQNGFRHVWMFSGKIDSDLKLKFSIWLLQLIFSLDFNFQLTFSQNQLYVIDSLKPNLCHHITKHTLSHHENMCNLDSIIIDLDVISIDIETYQMPSRQNLLQSLNISLKTRRSHNTFLSSVIKQNKKT